MGLLTELIKESLEGKLSDQIRACSKQKRLRKILMKPILARASRYDTESLVH